MVVETGLELESFKALLEKLQVQCASDALQRNRQKAWQHYLALGLPSGKHEPYRYIKLRQLFSQSFLPADIKPLPSEQISAWIYPECKKSVLVFINGAFVPELSCLDALLPQVVVTSLQEAVQTYSTFLNNQWTKSLKEEIDPFAALNAALHQRGAFLYFPPKCCVEAAIQVLHIIDGEEPCHVLMPRLQILVGAHANVKMIARQVNLSEASYFVNQAAELALEEGAHVQYTQVLCDEGAKGWHFDAFRATLKRDSFLKTVCVTEGNKTARMDYRISLMGENAEALLNGVWMLADKREAHAQVVMDHQAPHCRSYQLFKGVLSDFSRSSFGGKIMVRQPAQKTEAFQLNNNLLLSDQAHADSKPNLEIFADDVKASHGTTVGQLDSDQLFYMKTRGFSDRVAKNLLVSGFCGQVTEMIAIPSLQRAMAERAGKFLTKEHA